MILTATRMLLEIFYRVKISRFRAFNRSIKVPKASIPSKKFCSISFHIGCQLVSIIADCHGHLSAGTQESRCRSWSTRWVTRRWRTWISCWHRAGDCTRRSRRYFIGWWKVRMIWCACTTKQVMIDRSSSRFRIFTCGTHHRLGIYCFGDVVQMTQVNEIVKLARLVLGQQQLIRGLELQSRTKA